MPTAMAASRDAVTGSTIFATPLLFLSAAQKFVEKQMMKLFS
jgi:hypothetical protein